MEKKPNQKLVLDNSKLKEEWVLDDSKLKEEWVFQLPKQTKEVDHGVRPKSTKRP